MDDHPFSLSGKTIFVTGASAGIGRSVAAECSKIGAKLIITGRNEERLNETFNMLEGDGHQQLSADLSRSDEIGWLTEKLPDLDGFVSNAGMSKLLPVQFINERDLHAMFQINTVASILLTRSLVKQKKLRNPSSIVYTSSIAGVYSVSAASGMYSASKGALHGFMKNAALELAKKGIRCNSVNPGFVETDLTELKELTETQRKSHLGKYPLKRFGKPKDVAFAVIYLLSEASDWVTGTALRIDGGFTLH